MSDNNDDSMSDVLITALILISIFALYVMFRIFILLYGTHNPKGLYDIKNPVVSIKAIKICDSIAALLLITVIILTIVEVA